MTLRLPTVNDPKKTTDGRRARSTATGFLQRCRLERFHASSGRVVRAVFSTPPPPCAPPSLPPPPPTVRPLVVSGSQRERQVRRSDHRPNPTRRQPPFRSVELSFACRFSFVVFCSGPITTPPLSVGRRFSSERNGVVCLFLEVGRG